jgi:hypothetical protein
MLVPAAVLVLVILGAVVVDSAVVFLAQRELNNRAAAAANDAAAVALDEVAYYRRGSACLDVETVRDVVAAAFANDRLPSSVGAVEVASAVNGRTVTVSVRGEVPLVFAPAVPGVSGFTTVRTRAAATAVGDLATDTHCLS